VCVCVVEGWNLLQSSCNIFSLTPSVFASVYCTRNISYMTSYDITHHISASPHKKKTALGGVEVCDRVAERQKKKATTSTEGGCVVYEQAVFFARVFQPTRARCAEHIAEVNTDLLLASLLFVKEPDRLSVSCRRRLKCRTSLPHGKSLRLHPP
jgi:hypothetical protein